MTEVQSTSKVDPTLEVLNQWLGTNTAQLADKPPLSPYDNFPWLKFSKNNLQGSPYLGGA